jgi:hypothetical protein
LTSQLVTGAKSCELQFVFLSVTDAAPGGSALLALTAGNASGTVYARDYTDSIAAALVCVDI